MKQILACSPAHTLELINTQRETACPNEDVSTVERNTVGTFKFPETTELMHPNLWL